MRISEVSSLLDCLLVVRESLETGSQYSGGRADIRSAYLRYEEVRFPFASFVAEIGRNRIDIEILSDAFGRLTHDIEQLLRDTEFMEIVSRLPTSRRPRRRDNVGKLLSELQRVGPRTIDLGEFLGLIHRLLAQGLEREETDLFNDRESGPRAEDISRLSKIVPQQKIAPIHFDIRNGNLIVKPAEANAISGSEALARSAKEELLARGAELVAHLKRSNCDPRLLESATELQKQLEAGGDVVRLGLSNIGFGILSGKFDAEMPEALSAMAQAHSVGLAMYVAQFPEWVKFTQNAAAISLENNDISNLSRILNTIVRETQNPKIADPEVPKTLQSLQTLLHDPKGASSKASLAVIRSLENLVIRIFGYANEYLDKTMQKSIDTGSSATSKLLVGTLLAVALGAAINLSPIASKVEGMGWMNDAIQIVQRQLNALKE